MSDAKLAKYYAERASEYDAIYRKPERQEDIKSLSVLLSGLLKNRRVLEVACGTGYWTRLFGPGTESTTATDLSSEVLAIAGSRLINQKNVFLQRADAFRLDNVPDHFNAGIAAFWWSHLEKSNIGSFLKSFHSKLTLSSRVVFADNRYVEGSSTPVSRTDEHGNTYQNRVLGDGTKFEVAKNFPSETEFRSEVSGHGKNVCFKEFTYFWCGWYETLA